MNTKDIFNGKKATIMGLGLLGGAVNDALFLLKNGVELIITDLKTADILAPSIEKLKTYESQVTYVLGEHRLEDFAHVDFVLQPGNVPIDSIHLAEARKNNIPIHVSESLFALYAHDVTLIGVTGTRGKSTVTHGIYEVLKRYNPTGHKVHLGGNVRGVSTLALLADIGPGDVVVLELDSWALHSMGEIQKSPTYAVFTSFFPDHMNYYKDDMDAYLADKAQIFLHQKEGDICIVGEQVVPYIEDKYPDVYARAIVVGNNSKLDKTKTHFVGEHTMRNLSLVYEVLTHFALSPENIRKAFADLRPVAGRLELISEKNNIRIYNDNNATTPDATIAGLQAVGDKSNTYLIIGGADKGLSTETLSDTVGLKVAHTYVIPGSGSDGFVEELAQKNIPYTRVDTLEEAVASAWSRAQAGDCLLFSPAFTSFGMYNNEYERNDEFVEIVRNIQE